MRLFILALLQTTFVGAQAPGSSELTELLKKTGPQVESLLSQRRYKEALALSEGMLPAAKPSFDASDPRKVLTSSETYSTLMAIHSLAGKVAALGLDKALARRHWIEAREVARENYAKFYEHTKPVIDTWDKAMVESRANLESAALKRKEAEAKADKDRTPQDLEVLRAVAIWEGNLTNGAKVIQQIRNHADGLRKDSEAFDIPLANLNR